MTDTDRAQRFRDDVARLRARTDAGDAEKRMLGVGGVLMALGLAACVVAYFSSTAQTFVEDQNESIILALTGVGAIVAGSALFLRYSLARFLKIWMLRLLYEMRLAAEVQTEGEQSAPPSPEGQ